MKDEVVIPLDPTVSSDPPSDPPQSDTQDGKAGRVLPLDVPKGG